MYVKKYDENGVLTNPITKGNPFINKPSRGRKPQKPWGHGAMITLGKPAVRYLIREQHIAANPEKNQKAKTVIHMEERPLNILQRKRNRLYTKAKFSLVKRDKIDALLKKNGNSVPRAMKALKAKGLLIC